MNNKYLCIKAKLSSYIMGLCLIVIYFGITGCRANHRFMIPSQMHLTQNHKSTVSVSVEWGKRADGVKPQRRMRAEDFQIAVENALKKYELFSDVLDNESGEYILEIVITLVEIGGRISVDANMVARWSLTDARTGDVLWRDLISTVYIARVGEAFMGEKRFVKAIEGAARQNIQRAMEALSETDLVAIHSGSF